jgi:1,4-alpha-glucan branching enzyme
MKRIPIVLLLSLSTLLGQAPNNTSETPPRERRSRRPPPVISPEVAEDQKVTFRLQAAKANEVLLRGQWSKEFATLTKGDNDVWSVTVGPVEPGVWEYSFVVDGLAMIDPGNTTIKPMRSPRTSILHLPGSPH